MLKTGAQLLLFQHILPTVSLEKGKKVRGRKNVFSVSACAGNQRTTQKQRRTSLFDECKSCCFIEVPPFVN